MYFDHHGKYGNAAQILCEDFFSPTWMQPRENSQTGVRWADVTLEFPTLRGFPLDPTQNSPNFFEK